MSTTVTPTPAPPPTDPTNGKPLISSSAATQGSAAASGGAAAAILVLVIWGLNGLHISVPPEDSAALAVLLGMGVHWLVVKYGLPNT